MYNTDLDPEDEYETAGIWSNGATPTIVNCIIWSNGDDLAGGSPSGMATYSCIENEGDENEGEGNIHADPLLVGSIYGPYRLGYGSPCIDAGTPDPSALPIPDTDIDDDPRLLGRIDIGSDERNDSREVAGIKRDYVNDSIIVTWKTDMGNSYGVHRSKNVFSNYMSWVYIGNVDGNGGLVRWEDTSINFGDDLQAYYKVLNNSTGVWTRPVGFIDSRVADINQGDGYESTFFAIPLRPMYDLINAAEDGHNESLARMVAGHADLEAEKLSDGDQIEFLRLGYPETWSDPDDFVQLQLEWAGAVPRWYAGPIEAQDRFEAGQVFRIVEGTGCRAAVTFVGHVPCGQVGFVPFRSLYGWFSVEFGYPYPVHTTLNDVAFLEHGAIGEPDDDSHSPDRIFTPSPEWRPESQTLWLKDDPEGPEERGHWYLGNDPAASPVCDVIPGKGFRYLGRQADPAKDDSTFYIYDNIYWRRVPIARPYRP